MKFIRNSHANQTSEVLRILIYKCSPSRLRELAALIQDKKKKNNSTSSCKLKPSVWDPSTILREVFVDGECTIGEKIGKMMFCATKTIRPRDDGAKWMVGKIEG